MDYGSLNLGSLVLGLVAWILPFVNLIGNSKFINKNWVIFSAISITACAISLCFQIFYTNHLVNIEDWTAILDTLSSVAFVSAILLIATIVLNVMAWVVYYIRRHNTQQTLN